MKNATWLLSMVLLLMMGCGGGEADTQADRPVIGVSLLTLSNPFFIELGDALRDQAESEGYDVVIVSSDFDVNKQKNQVSDFIVRNVAAIVLTPSDSRAIATAIAEANEAGVPVFTADIAVMDPEVDVVAHIATDNYQAGEMAAQAMVEALGTASAEVGIIDYPEVESVILRTRGFSESIEAHNANGGSIEIVSRLNGGSVKDRGFKVAQDMLQAHPDLKGIFAINDQSALGAVAALEEAGKAGSIVIVAVDGVPEGRQAIKDGKIYADAVQYPDQIGRKAVDAIIQYMNGEAVQSEILIPTGLYRQADGLADTTLE